MFLGLKSVIAAPGGRSLKQSPVFKDERREQTQQMARPEGTPVAVTLRRN